MKSIKEFIPLDDYERELLEYENDKNYNPNYEISEKEKEKYQQIAKNSLRKNPKTKKQQLKSCAF